MTPDRLPVFCSRCGLPTFVWLTEWGGLTGQRAVVTCSCTWLPWPTRTPSKDGTP